MAVDIPPEIKWNPSQQINPPPIIETIEREYWVCKIVWWVMKMTKEWVIVTLENPEARKKIADTFNWSVDERQNLKEDILVWNLRQKLIDKYKEYPQQNCFFEKAEIRVMQLGNNMKEYDIVKEKLWTDIFLLFWNDWKLLFYLDKDWNTIFDISSFNFDEDFANLAWKINFKKYIRKNSEWFLELYYEWRIFSQWSPEFNTIVSRFHITWKLLNRKSR